MEFGNSNSNPASIGEIENDKIFLVQFMLPLAGVVLKTKIPKLTALAEIAKIAAKGKAFAFYTKGTRMEVHELLKEVLEGFIASLEEVAKCRGDAKDSIQGSSTFIKAVERVRILGYGLHKLVKGCPPDTPTRYCTLAQDMEHLYPNENVDAST